MQMKVILFLFAFRAVAAFLDFQLLSESENGEEDGNAQSKSFDFKEANQFLRNISSRVGVFLTKGGDKFSEMEDKISKRKGTYEESLGKSLEKAEVRLKAEGEKEIKKVLNKVSGKDETEIQKCLENLSLDLRNEMQDDFDAVTDCFKYATEEAIGTVEESKENFNLTVLGSLNEMIILPFTLKSCFDEKNTSCVEKGVADTRQNIKLLIELGKISFQTSREAVIKQKQEMDECRDEFLENLRQVEEAFFTLIRQCINSAEFIKDKKEEKKVKYKRH